MSNHVKFCGCRHCRRGMRTKVGGEMVKRTLRKFRRVAKAQRKRGEEPSAKGSVPYTD